MTLKILVNNERLRIFTFPHCCSAFAASSFPFVSLCLLSAHLPTSCYPYTHTHTCAHAHTHTHFQGSKGIINWEGSGLGFPDKVQNIQLNLNFRYIKTFFLSISLLQILNEILILKKIDNLRFNRATHFYLLNLATPNLTTCPEFWARTQFLRQRVGQNATLATIRHCHLECTEPGVPGTLGLVLLPGPHISVHCSCRVGHVPFKQ